MIYQLHLLDSRTLEKNLIQWTGRVKRQSCITAGFCRDRDEKSAVQKRLTVPIHAVNVGTVPVILNYIEVSGQHHAPAALRPWGKQSCAH
jgi:hypothetical protein